MKDEPTEPYFPERAQALSPEIMAVASVLRDVLSALEPVELTARETLVLPEGDEAADLLLCHPSIPELCLAVAVGPAGVSVYWAQVSNLELKDELDAVRNNATIKRDAVPSDPEDLRDLGTEIRGLLTTPLDLVEVARGSKAASLEIHAPGDAVGGKRTIWTKRIRSMLPPLPKRRTAVASAPFFDLVVEDGS